LFKYIIISAILFKNSLPHFSRRVSGQNATSAAADEGQQKQVSPTAASDASNLEEIGYREQFLDVQVWIYVIYIYIRCVSEYSEINGKSKNYIAPLRTLAGSEAKTMSGRLARLYEPNWYKKKFL
jgi:hypothetical protein